MSGARSRSPRRARSPARCGSRARVDPSSGHQQPELAGRENELILICAQGYQSSLAAATLHELGFPGVRDVIGGFEAWEAAGLPVEPGASGEA
jgi:rhodanese-related sulfurtransferase